MPRSWPALDVVLTAGAAFSGSGDELLHAALRHEDIAAIEERGDRWRVFFHDAAARDRALADLGRALPHHAITPLDVPDEDWAAKSQAGLRAIQIGNIVVAPPWDVPETDRPINAIVIQPSMGFGTGHHATTRLCLQALQQVDLHRRSVLDVGTGSGVLAIAASLLGASPVVAIDDDPDAMQSARENVALNPGATVDVRLADLRTAAPGRFDTIVANLTGGLLIQAAGRLQDRLSPGGMAIFSGFMASEEADVLAAHGQLSITARVEEDEWVCVTLLSR